MTDYVFQSGSAGKMRHASGGSGAKNPYPWIGHPRERASARPEQPRFALSGAAWAEDLATFQGLVTASAFGKAVTFITNNGFKIEATDVPEASRAAFIGWTRANLGDRSRTLAASEILSGEGWS
jgi:hypothetical protein